MIPEALQRIASLKKNKDLLPGLVLLAIFLFVSYLLFPHKDSKPKVEAISTSKLPQAKPSAVVSPKPTIAASQNHTTTDKNAPPATIPTPTGTTTSSSNNATNASSSQQSSPADTSSTENVPTTTPSPTVDQGTQNTDPTPTPIQTQDSNQTTGENSPNQATPTPGGSTLVGAVIHTVGTITSNLPN